MNIRGNDLVQFRIAEAMSVIQEFQRSCSEDIHLLSQLLVDTFKRGSKLLICGNGGSAADAQHFAAELVGSFCHGLERRSLPAIALTTDTSILTALANDFEFELIFSRQVEGLGKAGDSLLVISTSGESKNCIKATLAAKNMGIKTLALTSTNSTISSIVDFAISVPSKNTQHIQECHIICYHILAELVENTLIGNVTR